MKPSRIAAFAIWAVLATPVAAQKIDAGQAAYEAGDYATALENFQPLAEQGNAVAQVTLGFMYANGQGVPQDIVLAHMWFNIASANGSENATQIRATIVKEMTREQIADAQARARVCLSSGYQDCE